MNLRKVISVIILLALLTMSACGDTKTIEGVEYDTIGVFNQSEKRNPDIHYEPIWGNMFWGGILCATVAAPVYFFGFSMWEPICPKDEVKTKGQVVNKEGK